MSASPSARSLAALLNKLRQRYRPEAYPPRDPVSQLVVAFLQWEATRRQAELALARIQAATVDNNELRVSHNHEIIAMIGPTYPRCEERVARLRESMQEIYIREHAISLDALAAKGRKEARAYIESLPGITPYVSALTLLTVVNVPTLPVDERLVSALAAERIVEDGVDPGQAAAMLDKLLKADETLDAHLLLQAWADDRKAAARPAPRKPARSATVKKKK